MASPGGRSSSDLKAELLEKGQGFSFFQVIRLLRLLSGEGPKSPAEEGSDFPRLRIRPELSLSFPASDVASVEGGDPEGSRFQVTTTFLALYGSSSPLPTFYTEDLIHEALQDVSTTRHFIDLVNHRLFSLLFHFWAKYRQWLKVAEEKDPRDLERLFCLLGLGEEELRKGIPEVSSLLRYLGLFTQFPRSAMGLTTLLQDALEIPTVEVIPCALRKVKIPPDQRCSVGGAGNILGETSFLGEEMDDRLGKFRLQIGPLRGEAFHSLLPGEPKYRKLMFLTQIYLTDPLEYDLLLILEREEARTVCLGAPQWSRLGWDTWVFSNDSLGEMQTILPSQGQSI